MIFDWLVKKLRPREPFPDYWEEYLASLDRAYAAKTPLEELRFVAFDTETTGLNIKKDHILSIGAVSVRNWEIDLSQALECYVQQAYQPMGKTIEVHGILPGAQNGQQVGELEAVKRFLHYCHGSILVGHHIGFDLAMVNRVLAQELGQKLKNKTLDTAGLARRVGQKPYYEQPGTYGLDALCRRYGIPMSDRHTAAGDAFITAILLMKLLARLKKRGVRTFGELFRSPL